MRTHIMIAAAALLSLSGMAKADPPDAGSYRAISIPIIACDTRAQMDEVVQSVKDGKLLVKLQEMNAIRDDHNEPVCIYSPLGSVAFGESVHLGQIQDHERTINAWISHVGNQRADFYVLWGEEVKTDPV
jgi:hypothetical protein